MLDQLKQIKNLSKLRKLLAKQEETIKEKGIEITINGNLEVKDLKLNMDLTEKAQEEILKKIFNKAVKKIQMDIAQEISKLS